jgi:hypothetical protein
MSDLEPGRLALIVSEQRDEGGASEYVYGTGYFLTPQLVLTASHVVPEDTTAIEVHWGIVDVSPKNKIPKQTVNPAWRNRELDAVLLRVLPGLENAALLTWMEIFPKENQPWSSLGYPCAAAEDNGDRIDLTSIGLDGKFYPLGGSGQGKQKLDLGVESQATPQGWRGISGAPVFVEGKFAGIIKDVLDGFQGRRLSGIPAPVLLSAAGFRETLEPEWLSWPTDRPWALVLKADDAGDDLQRRGGEELERRVVLALRDFNDPKSRKAMDEAEIQPKPVVANIREAISSPGKWLQLVKALCEAPVMIADVTGFQPGVMIALGVRAVVRRAITITSTADHYEDAHLGQLPFNIQETKLVCHGGQFASGDPRSPSTVISNAIRNGLLESRLHSRYLDLPAYDAVRCPIPESTVGLPSARESVLVLCSFHQDYSENWIALSGTIDELNKINDSNDNDERKKKAPVVRMLDLSSPRLVGQALYEYVRWAATCIVDWSGWRPNVFFELGVRLACSSAGAMSVIESTESAVPTDSQKQMLLKLFQPTAYNRDNSYPALEKAYNQHNLALSGQTDGIGFATLPYDATYQTATASFSWKQDDSIVKPPALLRASVLEQTGKDPQRAGVPQVLFSANQEFGEQVRKNMQERWVAAWYYMKYRYPEDIKKDPEKREELKNLGESLLNWIKDTTDAHLKNLTDEVWAYIDEYEHSKVKD